MDRLIYSPLVLKINSQVGFVGISLVLDLIGLLRECPGSLVDVFRPKWHVGNSFYRCPHCLAKPDGSMDCMAG